MVRMESIPEWPVVTEVRLGHRDELHSMFKALEEGISEFSFANIYLFRESHRYGLSMLADGLLLITGSDAGEAFFMLPSGLPARDVLDGLLERFSFMKNASEAQARLLGSMGYGVAGDRDNFDYLYSTEELASLSGRKYHKKKNLVNAFIGSYNYQARPLLEEYAGDALQVIEEWRKEVETAGDYASAVEAVERMEELELCGGIYYVDGRPAAYTLGEEIGRDQFVIHFEKGLREFKGLMQFVVQSFAQILPEKYRFINREQDLGIEGIRKAKMGYRPVGFVKKFRVGARQTL